MVRGAPVLAAAAPCGYPHRLAHAPAPVVERVIAGPGLTEWHAADGAGQWGDRDEAAG